MSARDMVDVALSQVGYLEKASNSDLSSFTGNAGYNNWTKYGAWYGGGLNGQPWCDMFVSWCAYQAGELDAVGKYAYCPSHVNFFKSQSRWYNRGTRTPQPGDIIFFQSGGEAAHVGIVEHSDGTYVYTIEGNASGSSGLTPNGGGVVRKSYALGSSYILGYGVPAYNKGGSTANAKQLKVYDTWKAYQNGSTPEPVYKDTGFGTQTGTLNPGESCYCTGRYGDAYCVIYKLDGTVDDWAVGYVAYNGGIQE